MIGRAHGSAVPDSASNGEQAFLERLASTIRFFVDVGANKGDWTAMLLALHPEAEGLLFDPSSSALKILRARFAASQNVEIVPAGVGDAPGALSFYEEEAAGETSSLLRAAAHRGVRDRYR